MISEIKKVNIKKQIELNHLIINLKNGEKFASAFIFDSIDLYNQFFWALGINVDDFRNDNYYFDKARNIHISESLDGYVWISTV